MKTSPMMVRKFYTMFVSGTIGTAIVSIALMSGTLIAGIMLNVDSVEAITLVSPLYSFSAFFAYIVSIGFPIIYSKAIGSMDKRKADQVFGTGLLVSILMGIALFLLLWFVGEQFLKIYQPREEVLSLAAQYLFWLRFAVLLLPLICLMNAAVYADGDAAIFNIASIAQLISTILFGVLFCHLFGIAGISLGFFLAILISIIISFLHLLKKNNSLKLNLCFSRSSLLGIIKYSVVDAGTNLFLSLFTFTMNIFVTLYFGSGYIVLVSAVSLIRQFQMFVDGIGQGASPIIGTYLGEKSYAGVKKIYRVAERTALIVGILFTTLIIAFAFLLPGFLGISDPELSAVVTNGVRILGISTVFISLIYWITSYYIIAGHAALGVVTTALKDVLLAAPLAILFVHLTGSAYGFFIGLCIAPAVVWGAVILYLRVKYGKENYKYLFTEPSDRSLLFPLHVAPDEIVKVRNEVEAVLKSKQLDPKTIYRTTLLIEELFMMIYEKNSTPVQGECCLNLDKNVELIIRDNGMLLDLTDPDMPVTSFRDYLISSYIDNMEFRRNSGPAMGFNRNHFQIDD